MARKRASGPPVIVTSKSIHDIFMGEEIRSLTNRKEHMGVACIDNHGKVIESNDIKSVATVSSARSTLSINELGKNCKKGRSIFWHTHNATLSSMSAEDRISAGNLKVLTGNDYMCAIGIEGYSCHILDRQRPRIVSRRWDESYFNTLKKSPVANVIFDSNTKWKLEKKLESDVHHLVCTMKEGVFVCSGIDWDTGLNQFPVGAYHQVLFTGNVDVSPSVDGVDVLASSIDKKLECIAIDSGIERKIKILYCR
jgi:hypothetical protein